jgi:hypothetical protein
MPDPNELKNSRRVLEKVTYAPVIVAASDTAGGALEIATAVRGLNLVPGEAAAAAQQASQSIAKVLTEFESLMTAASAAERLQASSDLAQNSTSDLTAAVDAIHKQRENALNSSIAALIRIVKLYEAAPQQRSSFRPKLRDRSLRERCTVPLRCHRFAPICQPSLVLSRCRPSTYPLPWPRVSDPTSPRTFILR